MIRFTVDSISETGRATQGVRVIRLDDGSSVSTFAKVEHVVPEEETTSADDTDETDSDDLPMAPEDGEQPSEVAELLQRAEDDEDK